MAMRETERSLRWYLLLAGAGSTLSSLGDLGDAFALPALPITWTVALWFPLLAHLVLGVAFVVAGVRLEAALAGNPGWITRMLIATGAVLLVELGLIWSTWGNASEAFARERFAGAALVGMIGIVITAYLYANVNRLAREARSRASDAVFE